MSEHIDIANTAVDNDTFPAVFRGPIGNHVAQQGMAQRTATVNHQHFAFTVEFSLLLDPRIVFETLDGHDLATKGVAPAEIAEHGLKYLHQLRVGIAQIGGDVVIHGKAPVQGGHISENNVSTMVIDALVMAGFKSRPGHR